MNTVIIKGNLARDPETRYTTTGTAITSFGIGVNRKWKDSEGQSHEEVSFFEIEAWGKTGELISQYFGKGNPILVQGRLKQETWEDKKTNQKRSKVKIVLESFDFCGSSKGAGSKEQPARQTERRTDGSPTPNYRDADALPVEDDVPF